MSTAQPKHKRILLKLSGEALMGDDPFGINRDTIVRMVDEIAEVTRMGVEVAGCDGRGRGHAGPCLNLPKCGLNLTKSTRNQEIQSADCRTEAKCRGQNGPDHCGLQR